MVDTLLKTKLYIPQARPALVSRPHLIEQLNEGLHRKLTLISAPPGFGKPIAMISAAIAAIKARENTVCCPPAIMSLPLCAEGGGASRIKPYALPPSALPNFRPFIPSKMKSAFSYSDNE